MTVTTLRNITDTFRSKGQYTVWARASWADAWELQDDNLLPVELVRSANAISELTLRWHYGSVQHKGDQTVSLVDPIALAYKWVKVVIVPYNADATNKNIVFTGIVTSEQRMHLGTDANGQLCGDQMFKVSGPEYVLARSQIVRSWVYDANFYGAGIPGTFIVQRAINFNGFATDRTGRRFLQGNKQFAQSYFAKELKNGQKWTAKEIVNYILSRVIYNTVDDALSVIDSTNGPQFFIDIDGALDYTPGEIKTQGQTFFDVLNQLFNRKRGLTWFVEPMPSPELGFWIKVESLSDTTLFVAEFGMSFVENRNQIAIDVQHGRDIETFVQVTDYSQKYDKIKVVGGKQGAVFTLSYGEFLQDWKFSDEQRYNAAYTSDPAYLTEDRAENKTRNDQFRMEPQNRIVFTRFYISQFWDGTDYFGQNVFPDFNAPTEAFLKSLNAFDAKRPVWHQSMRFLPYLALKEGFDYTTLGSQPVDNNPPLTQPNYLKPRVFGKVLDGKGNLIWTDLVSTRMTAALHELRGDGGSELTVDFRPHDHQLGFSVLPHGPSHLLQTQYTYYDDDSTDVGMSHRPRGETNYRDMFVTVYAQCDDEIFYERTRDDFFDDVRSTMVIRAGDMYRVDILLGFTVIGISGAGGTSPIRQLSKFKYLRDDRTDMMRLAGHASVWYANERRALNVQWNRIRGDVQLGAMVKRIQVAPENVVTTPDGTQAVLPDGENWILADETNEQVNSVISQITYDLENGSTRIQTQFMEIDFESAVQGGLL